MSQFTGAAAPDLLLIVVVSIVAAVVVNLPTIASIIITWVAS